jgi:hypothetical protein
MTCRICNHINEYTASHCSNCGNSLLATSSSKKNENKELTSVTSFSLISAVITAVIFNYFAADIFGRDGTFNYFELFCAMVVGGLGGVIGDRIGKKFKKKI